MGSSTSKKPKRPLKLKNYITWFEIPVLNLRRAVTFYNHIYGIEMETTEFNGYAMALFPADKGIGGALVKGQGCIPSENGTLIYLNAGEDLNAMLGRVEKEGGRVVLGKTRINEEAGYFAIFIDTEGNKIALNSKN